MSKLHSIHTLVRSAQYISSRANFKLQDIMTAVRYLLFSGLKHQDWNKLLQEWLEEDSLVDKFSVRSGHSGDLGTNIVPTVEELFFMGSGQCDEIEFRSGPFSVNVISNSFQEGNVPNLEDIQNRVTCQMTETAQEEMFSLLCALSAGMFGSGANF